MEITLDTTIIANLTPRGIMAYLAVQMLGGGEWTTAVVASIVQCATPAMLEGLTELAASYPSLISKCGDRKWCKTGTPSAIALRHGSPSKRRQEFMDDLSKFWTYLNPDIPFQFIGADGNAVSQFLNRHKAWPREAWLVALRNRARSKINTVQPFHQWLARLPEYLKTPLNEYGKPLDIGGSGHGKAREKQDGNRNVIERAIAAAGADSKAKTSSVNR